MAALLATHGHVTAGPTTVQHVTIGDTTDIPWLLYLEVSQAIGLDFRGQEGARAEIHVTPVAGRGGTVSTFVLVREGRPIGAWLDPGANASGVLSLRDEP